MISALTIKLFEVLLSVYTSSPTNIGVLNDYLEVQVNGMALAEGELSSIYEKITRDISLDL